MGTTDATVTATFEAVETHQIRWSVNGVIVKTDNVEDGAAIDFATPTSGIPNGYAFQGWVTEANKIGTPTDTDPSANYVFTATSDADITYYAVMAIVTSTEPTLTKMGSGDTFAAGDKVVIVATYNETSYAIYQETINSSYVNKYVFSNNAAEVAADDKKWLTVSAGTKSGTWKLGDSTNGYIYNASSNDLTANTSNSSNFTLAWNSTEDKFTLVANSRRLSYRSDLTNEYFRMGGSSASSPSGTAYFDIYKFIPISYAGYCTSAKVSVTVTSANYATYVSDFDLDFTDKGIKAYIAKADGTTGVTFEQVKKVPANTGVLLYKDGGTTEEIPVLSGDADDVTGNVFKPGTGAAVASEDGTLRNYILNQRDGVAGFYKANNQMVATNRAYIQIDEKRTPVKGFIALPGSDEETGIETMRDGENEKMSAIFDLSGRRVAKPTRGLYIVNGKKVIVK